MEDRHRKREPLPQAHGQRVGQRVQMRTEIHDLLGTIAGDDTVLVISRRPDGGPALAERFLALANGSHAGPEQPPEPDPDKDTP